MASLIFLTVGFLLIFLLLLSEFIRNDQPFFDALVHNEELISFCALDLE